MDAGYNWRTIVNFANLLNKYFYFAASELDEQQNANAKEYEYIRLYL